jgi:hypothetical protein
MIIMPMPKIYTEKNAEDKLMPMLDIDEQMRVIAVDLNGIFLAYISGEKYYNKVKQSLENEGYDTSWAEWDDEGCFVKLTQRRILC